MTIRVITPNAIAAQIGFTSAYIRQLCEQGEIPARKVGKYWRIEEADFEAWWAKGKTGPVADDKVISIAKGKRA